MFRFQSEAPLDFGTKRQVGPLRCKRVTVSPFKKVKRSFAAQLSVAVLFALKSQKVFVVSAKLLRQKYANLEKTVKRSCKHGGDKRLLYDIGSRTMARTFRRTPWSHDDRTCRLADRPLVVTPQQSNYLFNNKRARAAGVVSSEIVLI